ncbi:DUF4031 domain-containing protein [Pseudoxanthomonas putridarboris]|uniref:DUF4031 domain-containing protein n=1 Tax=Pseudoxanthomonas putridarboris TaxID=752605 RepID=A0ABU9J272_9GAMM
MSVYVDDAITLWRGRRWAHMMADTLGELHAMAKRLGIPRRAFQDKASGAHYDLTVELREEALRLGAIAISRHRDRDQVRAVIRNARAQWSGAGRGESREPATPS